MSYENLIEPHDHAAIAAVDQIEGSHEGRPELGEHDELASVAALAPRPIKADCERDYFPALRISGRRPLSVVKWIVMHAEEAFTAESAASWFRNPKAKGSAHLCVDGATCFRCLPNDAIPWGAPGGNYRGFHIEQGGYTRWDAQDWAAREFEIQRSAFKAAQHCKLFGIPVRFVDHTGLSRGYAGITTHLECTRAFGGDHTDPGSGWPRARFITLAKAFRAKL